MSYFLDYLRAQASKEELWSLLRAYFEGFGARRCLYVKMGISSADSGRPEVMQFGYPLSLAQSYSERKLYLVDPLLRCGYTATRPYVAASERPDDDLDPQDRRLIDAMHGDGETEDVVFQVFGPGLANGVFALGLEKIAELRPTTIEQIRRIGQAAHVRICELSPPALTVERLSPREREILAWIASGKSNVAIAGILKLSPHTIDTMVRRIFEKLEVGDRTLAAIHALAAGLIVPMLR